MDFDDPQGSCDLPNTRNVYVATEPGVHEVYLLMPYHKVNTLTGHL